MRFAGGFGFLLFIVYLVALVICYVIAAIIFDVILNKYKLVVPATIVLFIIAVILLNVIKI